MSTTQAEFYRGLEAASAALRQREHAPPAERAAGVHDAIEPLLEDTEVHARLACRLGCSHCCHYPVGVTYPEAMRLAAAVRKHPELVEHLQREHRDAAADDWNELVGRPCPLLRENACAVHEARPMPCRALGSTDDAACAAALRGTATDAATATPPRDEKAWWRGLGAAKALANTSPEGSRELRSAVFALLEAPPSDREAAFTAARVAPGS